MMRTDCPADCQALTKVVPPGPWRDSISNHPCICSSGLPGPSKSTMSQPPEVGLWRHSKRPRINTDAHGSEHSSSVLIRVHPWPNCLSLNGYNISDGAHLQFWFA